MMERLMTDQRKTVVTVLIAFLSVMVLLWFIRGPEINLSNLVFFAVSLLLIPAAALAVYAILYLNVRVNHISDRILRGICAVLFVGAAVLLAGSVLLAIRDFATHRSLPPPNLLAFGVALGAMKAWGLQTTTGVGGRSA